MSFYAKIAAVKIQTANKYHEKKLSSIFRHLRLAAAQVILCYESDRNSLRTDIRHTDHVSELSEEYAFRALCLWLITASGSIVYSDAIASEFEHVLSTLSEVWTRAGAYPFANDLNENVFLELLERARMLLHGCSATIEMIGALYEHVQKFPLQIDADGNFDISTHIQVKDKRRLVGQFYTPADIVDYCFERATDSEKDKFIIALKSNIALFEDAHAKPRSADFDSAATVLDPSCGTGNFLLGAIRLFRKFSDNPVTIMRLACSNLFGFELDGRAAALTRISIMIALKDAWMKIPATELKPAIEVMFGQLRQNIQNVDSVYAAPELLSNNKGAGKLQIVCASNFDRTCVPDGRLNNSGDEEKTYALVITNPPYVSFGARNQPKLPDSSTVYLRSKFPQSAEYKIRIHSIFQDIGLRLIRVGGVASLLVPDGFLTGGYYKKLRQLLLSQSKLRSLAELPPDTVPGAVVGRWCVASYERSERIPSDYQVALFSHINEKSESYSLPKSLLVSRDQNRFRLVFNDIDQKLCKLVDKLEPLSTQFRGRTGIRALHGQRSIVGDEPKGERWRRGIVSGSSVTPHMVTWNGDWLNIDASLLYKGGFDAQVIEKPKLLIRQTGDCLIAAYDEDGLYHLNNVHSLSQRSSANLSLHFIDGLLNSRFWLYIYRLKTREQGRALAQIDIETLESMPLPEGNADLERQVALFTQLFRKSNQAHEQVLRSRISRAIDKLVYDLYELDEMIVQQIERCCGKLNEGTACLPTASEMLTLQQLAESEEVVCRS
ncbi:MAG TPA: TaqI-like C-terminal specificity domain-containing protein [Drouetiella sp.]|jgi:adenine-specific DNA-methyltransferase